MCTRRTFDDTRALPRAALPRPAAWHARPSDLKQLHRAADTCPASRTCTGVHVQAHAQKPRYFRCRRSWIDTAPATMASHRRDHVGYGTFHHRSRCVLRHTHVICALVTYCIRADPRTQCVATASVCSSLAEKPAGPRCAREGDVHVPCPRQRATGVACTLCGRALPTTCAATLPTSEL